MKAQVIGRVGSGVGGRIYFFASDNKPLPADRLKTLQADLGYHPLGFDFFMNDCGPYRMPETDYLHNVMWSCSASCD